MFGIPGAIGAVFVYNLKTDDEFYNHFNDRYPDLIQAIHAYHPLDASATELAERTDIGPVTPTSELLDESEWLPPQPIAAMRDGNVMLTVPRLCAPYVTQR